MNKRLPLRVLSEEDMAFWKRYGYVIVRNAISKEAAQSTEDFLLDFQNMDPDNLETWYRDDHEFPEGFSWEKTFYAYGMVEAYHHQTLWDNRQNQRVYDAFVDVWDVEELWVTLDRANLNGPNNRNRTFEGPFIHWDIDTRVDPLPKRIQGIIALNDTARELGGFQCVPGLFENFDVWKVDQPDDRSGSNPDMDTFDYPIEAPTLYAGDLIIFNSLLAHGIAYNETVDRYRAAQYVSMMPALNNNKALTESRVNSWKKLEVPEWDDSFIGDKNEPESSRYSTAELTELGEKLLGVKRW
jgi:ectoine hydroxylase-related dioxygenase (phytanoyl-CoA dioxygenase family)